MYMFCGVLAASAGQADEYRGLAPVLCVYGQRDLDGPQSVLARHLLYELRRAPQCVSPVSVQHRARPGHLPSHNTAVAVKDFIKTR